MAAMKVSSEEWANRGATYAPLPGSSDDGHVTGHAVQTILVEPEALYDMWRDLELIPRWQEHVVSVTRLSDTESHWVMGDPDKEDGKRVEFDSRIVEDSPGKRIAWTSTGGDVEQAGSVTFEAVTRGTLVTLIQTVKIGKIANAVASTAERGPKQTVIENLRHFKQLAETGEIPSVKGQPHGPRGLSGGIKEWMYGETNPTPPGSSTE